MSESSHTKTFGYSDIPNQIPMSSSAHFPIASNSKLYTSVAIYQLAERGLLSLDHDIADLLNTSDFVKFGWKKKKDKLCPQLERINKKQGDEGAVCEKITLRNLLSMSSGIDPVEGNCDCAESTNPQCDLTPYIISRGSIGATVGTFLQKPLSFRPGTHFQYSNPNFVLATYFVEKVQRKDLSRLPPREYLFQNRFASDLF